jgi:hypothetical protein
VRRVPAARRAMSRLITEIEAGSTTSVAPRQRRFVNQWADIWMDAHGLVVRMIIDLALEEPEYSNQSWVVWDVLTLDPQDIGPLPPSS